MVKNLNIYLIVVVSSLKKKEKDSIHTIVTARPEKFIKKILKK